MICTFVIIRFRFHRHPPFPLSRSLAAKLFRGGKGTIRVTFSNRSQWNGRPVDGWLGISNSTYHSNAAPRPTDPLVERILDAPISIRYSAVRVVDRWWIPPSFLIFEPLAQSPTTPRKLKDWRNPTCLMHSFPCLLLPILVAAAGHRELLWLRKFKVPIIQLGKRTRNMTRVYQFTYIPVAITPRVL